MQYSEAGKIPSSSGELKKAKARHSSIWPLQ